MFYFFSYIFYPKTGYGGIFSYTLIMGFATGTITWKTRNVYGAILLHAAVYIIPFV